MTDEYDPRWHAEHALSLLVALEDWDAHNDRYRRAAVRTARRRLERALEAGEPAPDSASRDAAADAEGADPDGGAV